MKVSKILEILGSRVSAGLSGIIVLRTMIERWVQPLKQRVRLLCYYTRVEDLGHETMEMLEASEVAKWVTLLVNSTPSS